MAAGRILAGIKGPTLTGVLPPSTAPFSAIGLMSLLRIK